MKKTLFVGLIGVVSLFQGIAQTTHTVNLPKAGDKVTLHSDWLAKRANEVLIDGNTLTEQPFHPDGWITATVPGTVLTTLLNHKQFPDPMFSMNNELIPDIYHVGNDFYTYWFVNRFETKGIEPGKRVWLNFRGINYRADIFLNGTRVNSTTHEGMFLRQSYEVTSLLKENAENRLAVIVYPPTHAGNPNGGQGGDGMIARNVTMQYTPGWDWIQAVRDRNTGIWDEVSFTTTGDVQVQHPYVVTKVPGVRQPQGAQKEAFVHTSVELKNHSSQPQNGTVVCTTLGKTIRQKVTLRPNESKEITFAPIEIKNPALWWPNGVGEHPLNDISFAFETENNRVSDQTTFKYGIRELVTDKDPATGGRRFWVNGQKIYITGGNYINSDWMLRLSPERYRNEVRFHADMNLRMIRVWGGALTERPEFYEACDEYGLLVFQDLWTSGDCNGAWIDPMKKESKARRCEYPDNHSLYLRQAEDQIKMLRNHASLALWCGGNEWPSATDIDHALTTDIMPRLDPSRLFASYSTDTTFTRNTMGGVGDGPYGIQEPEWFYTYKSSPFNPESGSVGSPEVESMRRYMTDQELAEGLKNPKQQAWVYHKDLGYGDHLTRYGEVNTIEEYCKYAQVVNYDQYRSFMEGWASQMWDRYTGILIWKTQNPWTALRGQMYDWYLDVNASFYGTKVGCEPLHPQFNLVSRQVELVNTALGSHDSLTLKAQAVSLDGKELWSREESSVSIGANSVKRFFTVDKPSTDGTYFLKLTLLDKAGKQLTDNFYWLTNRPKDYTDLKELPRTKPYTSLSWERGENSRTGTVTIGVSNGVSFFNRIKVFDKKTRQQILPVHYSDNYISLLPGDRKIVSFELPPAVAPVDVYVVIQSWSWEDIQL